MSFFEQAVALDTAYVPAWARLSQASSCINFVGTPTPALLERARFAAERALALAPDRPEAASGDGRLPTPDHAGLRARHRGSTARASGSPLERRAVPRHRAGRASARSVGRSRWSTCARPSGSTRGRPRAARRYARPAPGRDATTRRSTSAERWLASPRTTLRPTRPRRCLLASRAIWPAPGRSSRRRRPDPAHPVRLLLRDLLRDVLAARRASSSTCCSASRRASSTTIAPPGAWPSPASAHAPGRCRDGAGLRRLGAHRARGAAPRCARGRPAPRAPTASRSPTPAGRPRRSARASAASRCVPSPRTPSPGPTSSISSPGSTSWSGSRTRRWTSSSRCSRCRTFSRPAGCGSIPTFDPLRNNPRFQKLVGAHG